MVILSILYALEKIGIRIVPYYLTVESLHEDLRVDLKFQPVYCVDLDYRKIKELSLDPEFKTLIKEAEKWTGENTRCFGLQYNNEIIAYCWYNLKSSDSEFISFTLREDEAHLFRARTLNKYRGGNLAPLLRYNLYKYLNSIGKTRYYSITEYFNKPALNFKSKLKAKHIKLYLYIGLFNKIKRNILLKRYQQPE